MADNAQSITSMTEDGCWEFLSMQPIGRLGTAAAGSTNLVSYLEDTRDTWVRITPTQVAGRRLRR